MTETCKACGVTIEDNKVLFSCGKPGTRDRLYVRVCKYAVDKKNCINKNIDESKVDLNDFYRPI